MLVFNAYVVVDMPYLGFEGTELIVLTFKCYVLFYTSARDQLM